MNGLDVYIEFDHVRNKNTSDYNDWTFSDYKKWNEYWYSEKTQ